MSAFVAEVKSWQSIGGIPLNNGKIFIGTVLLDPVLNPTPIFSDRDLTAALPQPVLIDSFGNPTSKIWVPGRYSIKIEDSSGSQVFLELDNGEDAQSGITSLSNVQGINAITANANPTITAYVDKEQYIFTPANTNTGALTLDIDLVGAKAFLTPAGNAFISGELPANVPVIAVFNLSDTSFYLANPTNALEATGNKTDGQVLRPRSASTRGQEWENQTLTLAKAAAYTVVVADQGKLILLSGASFTVTLPVAATVGDGFKIGFKHGGTEGTDVYTIDGDAAETIDNELTHLLTRKFEILWIISDGVLWKIVNSIPLLTLDTKQASTSGTQVDFTGIPAGVKRIMISFKGVSLSGTDNYLVQLGDAGGFETSGYLSTAATIKGGANSVLVSSTTGFIMSADGTPDALSGLMLLSRMDGSHLWVSSHSCKLSTPKTMNGGGDKTLSAELTQIRITRTGTNTFDAGSINIMYE